jgi:hypothetical protein
MKTRIASIGLVLAALAAQAPAHADTQLVAQGPGTLTFYATSGNLACPGTLNVSLAISGSTFVLTESWLPPAPNPSGAVEPQAYCAINRALFVYEADNATPATAQECVPSPDPGVVPPTIGGPQWTMSGNGSATTPYVFQFSATNCAKEKILDKITLRTAAPMSYRHDVTYDNVYSTRSTASLGRVA